MKNSGISKILYMMGVMLGQFSKPPMADSKDVQDKHEGATNVLPYYLGHQPIHLLNRSQKAKSKRLIASNRRQGRA